MKENIYTIKRLCRELDQPRQKIRRRLIKLDIKAINENTRAYKNIPLEYDDQAFLLLAKEFGVSVNSSKRTTDEQHSTTDGQHNTIDMSKDKLIKVLEEQLKESNKSRENLERLLDQQQQLTLISNKKLEVLTLEIEQQEEQEEQEEVKKTKWYDVFKRKK